MFGEDLSESPRMPSPWSAAARCASPFSAATSASTTAPTTPPPPANASQLDHDPAHLDTAASRRRRHHTLGSDQPVSATQVRPPHARLSSYESQAAHLRSLMEAKLSSSVSLAATVPAFAASSLLGTSLDLRQQVATRILINSLPAEQQMDRDGDLSWPTAKHSGTPFERGCVDEPDQARSQPSGHDDAGDDGGGGGGDKDDGDEPDGFFSLDMDLDIDAPRIPVPPPEAQALHPHPDGNGRCNSSIARSSSSGMGNSPSPLTSFRRKSKHSDTPSPSFGPIAPEVDRRGNLEYKLKILPPSRERFDRLVTQLKWRLLEGGGLAVYEVGVLDDGTLIGLDVAPMKDSLKLLSAMAREVGARCEVRRVLAIERHHGGRSGDGAAAAAAAADVAMAAEGGAVQPPASDGSNENCQSLHFPVWDRSQSRDGGKSSSQQPAASSIVRALDVPEATRLLMPSTPSAGLNAGRGQLEQVSTADEVGRYHIALSYDDGDDMQKRTADVNDPDTLGESREPANADPAVRDDPHESSDEEGFGFSLSIDGDADTRLDLSGDTLASGKPPPIFDRQPAPISFTASDPRSGPCPCKVVGAIDVSERHSDGKRKSDELSTSVTAPRPGSAMPLHSGDLLMRMSSQPRNHETGNGSDANAIHPDIAAIDVEGVEAFTLARNDAQVGNIANSRGAPHRKTGQFGGRRGKDGRVPFVDPEMIVEPVSPADYSLLSEKQAKVKVGKMPKRRGKRRGASGWRIESEDDRDATGASLERRMRRLAELKAAERAGAGWTVDLGADETPFNIAAGQLDAGLDGSAGRSSNSIAQKLVQQMLALQLEHLSVRPAAAYAHDGTDGDGSTATPPVYNQPPFKALDEKTVSPILALDDAEIESARDADGVRELFQRKRQEILKQRQAYQRAAAMVRHNESTSISGTSGGDSSGNSDDSDESSDAITFLSSLRYEGQAAANKPSPLGEDLEAVRLAKMNQVADSVQPKTMRAQARARNAALATCASPPGRVTPVDLPSTGTGTTPQVLSDPSLEMRTGYENVMADLGMVSERSLLRAAQAAAGADAKAQQGNRLIVEAVIRRDLGRHETFTNFQGFEGERGGAAEAGLTVERRCDGEAAVQRPSRVGGCNA